MRRSDLDTVGLEGEKNSRTHTQTHTQTHTHKHADTSSANLLILHPLSFRLGSLLTDVERQAPTEMGAEREQLLTNFRPKFGKKINK